MKPTFCLNCGDRWVAPERDCPNPSPGVPYVDCGCGGHRFFQPPEIPGVGETIEPSGPAMHIGFTGTRYGMTTAQGSNVEFILSMFGDRPQMVHHGDCIGADAEFHDSARQLGSLVTVHPGPADDVARQAGCWGNVRHPPLPHMRRNKNIVLASEVVIAAPLEMAERSRGGTWSTIGMARKPLALVWPNGTISKERWL